MSIELDLPPSWATARLDEVCAINERPFSPLSTARDLPVSFVPMAAVVEEYGGIDVSTTRPLGEVTKGYTAFVEGDVLFAKITPCMENGKLALVPRLASHVGYGSTEFHVLRSGDAVHAAWLARYVSQLAFRRAARQDMSGSAGQLRVQAGWLAAASIPVAPISEQLRILQCVDETLSEIDAGVAELEAAKRRLALYRQSLLKSAVEGTLTATWRLERCSLGSGAELLQRVERWRIKLWRRMRLKPYVPASKLTDESEKPFEVPAHWVWASIDSVTQSSSYGTSVKCETGALGTPVLRIPNLRSGVLALDDLKRSVEPLGLDDDEYLTPGDVLVVRTNGSVSLVGRSACVPRPGLAERAYFASYLLRLRPVLPRMMGEWIVTWLSSPPARRLIERMAASSAGQHNIGLSALLRVPLPLPPLAEQQAILKLLRDDFAAVEVNELAIDRALKMATAQRQNILRAAFSGQLVPQDPNDEPAGVLLERIRATRAITDAKAPARHGRKAKIAA